MPRRTTHDSDDDVDGIPDDESNPDNTNRRSVPSGIAQPQQQQPHPHPQRLNDDPDTCRILLSTDNHLGYAERDSIRGMDSFAAFEEVLYLGQLYHVDLILLAGDVFHDNRPSRRTIYTTMEIVRRYCMGPNPIRIQILSDPNSLKSSLRSDTVNYLDPNYSVHLPIFAIHGNHDDPSRDQGSGELLAALDLFSITNLINYFGRQEEVDQIQISPILIQKGTTKVALYGLGSLRDERLNRMWEKQKVVFLRPEDDDVDDAGNGENTQNDDDDDDDDIDIDRINNRSADKGFFNIFALHQNRDLGRGTKNCIQESMIPEWMDVVVWGHEHECLIEFFESLVGTFRITQPGSSVATSLVPGEAVQKKIGILDVKGKQYRLHPVPLTQVRTFVMTEISLREHRSNLDPSDPKIDEKLNKLLEEEVQLMIMSARDKTKEQSNAARMAGNDAADTGNTTLKHKLQRPDEVLVRLRVDHVGYATINNQRFGAKFVGQVANPTDILLFHRKKDPKLASVVKRQGLKPMAPEELERTNMEDLVREQLVSDGKLNIYGEQDLSEALEEFVDKSGMVATIADIAADKLSATQKQLIKGKQGEEPLRNDSQILEVLERDNSSKVSAETPQLPQLSSNRSHTTVTKNHADNDTLQEEAEIVEEPVRNRKSAKVAAPKRRAASMDDSDDDDLVENSKVSSNARSFQQATTNRPKRAGAKSKVAYALDDSDDDEYISEEIVDSDDDNDEDEKPVAVRGSSRKKAPAPKGRAAAVRTTKKVAASTAKNTAKRSRMDDYDDSDDEIENNRNASDSADIDEDWGTAKTRTQRSQW